MFRFTVLSSAVTFLYAFFSTCTATPVLSIRTPVSSQQIPLNEVKTLIESRVRKSIDNCEDRVYELDDEGNLIGKDESIILSTLKEKEEDASPEEGPTIIINGVKLNDTGHNSLIRVGTDVTVVYDHEDHTILRVLTRGALLEPLDKKKYPGVYVNTNADFFLTDGEMKSSETSIPNLKTDTVTRQNGGCRNIEVAITFDNTFCALYQNSKQAASNIVIAVNKFASSIFSRDMCHTLTIALIEGYCQSSEDPYRSLANSNASPSTILHTFANYWQTNRQSVERDVAYLFTGFNEGSGVEGTAFLRGACQATGYGWVERGDKAFYVHEMGHSLGAEHTTEGVMKASINRSDRVYFSQVSISQINTFLQSSQASCTATNSR